MKKKQRGTWAGSFEQVEQKLVLMAIKAERASILFRDIPHSARIRRRSQCQCICPGTDGQKIWILGYPPGEQEQQGEGQA